MVVKDTIYAFVGAHRIDLAILQSEAFCEVLARLLRDRIPLEELNQKEYDLLQITDRIKNETYSESDRHRLNEMHSWIQQSKQMLEQQKPRVKRLSETFEESGI